MKWRDNSSRAFAWSRYEIISPHGRRHHAQSCCRTERRRRLRMKAKLLQDEFAKGGKFQYLLLRYTQALITQISQTAVCNRLHSVEQQLCRWLLLSHDRLNTDELIM